MIRILASSVFVAAWAVTAAAAFDHRIVDLSPPPNPWIKIAGDFNGDGHSDLAIGGQNGPLAVYAGPEWQKTIIADGGWHTVGGDAGDIDGDGDADIVVGAEFWFENPRPITSPSAGVWKRHRISELRTHDAILADLDRDGRLDLIARDQSGFGHNTGNHVHIFRQARKDVWEQHALACPHGEGISVVDIDRDGDLDLALPGRWLENTGRLNDPWQTYAYATNWTHAECKVAAADLNRDGRVDVVLAPAEFKGGTNRLSWFEAPSNPRDAWTEHIVVAEVETVLHALAAGDLDGDGAPEIVTAAMHQGNAPQRVSIFWNRAGATHWSEEMLSLGGSHNLVLADFNSDGRLDIAGANHGGPRQPAEIWFNRPAVAESPVAFPGLNWEEATPESQGMDSSKLTTAIEYLKAQAGSDGVRELVVVRNGRLIWRGDNIDKVHGVWSCTKSFTSTCLGLLSDDGKCALETRAAEFVPELAQHYGTVTLRHFTTMTSGYRAFGDEPQGSYKHGPSGTPFRPNPQALFTPPGSQYAYWDSAMNMFGLILTRIAGEPLESLFQRRIADPIGMNSKQWDWGDYATNNNIVVNGGSGNGGKHIFISARELARLGHLFLNHGNWNGRQLISSNWVRQATSPHVAATLPWAQPESEIDGRGCYGFNWWANGLKADGTRLWPGAPIGAFAALGHNNNKLFVIPEWQMVVVRLGLDQNEKKLTDQHMSEFLRRVGETLRGRTTSPKEAEAKAPGSR